MDYIYAITCKRVSANDVDWYIVQPVYADENTAYEKLKECVEQYSKCTDKNGIEYSCEYAMEKLKVSSH